MRSIAEKYSMTPGVGVVVFDPATLLIGGLTLGQAAVGATVAGGAVSAAGTLAGGEYAKEAGELQGRQLRMNASQALASSQRQMFDSQEKTRLAISTATARAAGSGVSPDVGSPLTNTGKLAQRGSYHALMDLFNGESAATGLRNQAAASEWEGEMKQNASYLAAGGQMLSSVGSAYGMAGRFEYPTPKGPAGANL